MTTLLETYLKRLLVQCWSDWYHFSVTLFQYTHPYYCGWNTQNNAYEEPLVVIQLSSNPFLWTLVLMVVIRSKCMKTIVNELDYKLNNLEVKIEASIITHVSQLNAKFESLWSKMENFIVPWLKPKGFK